MEYVLFVNVIFDNLHYYIYIYIHSSNKYFYYTGIGVFSCDQSPLFWNKTFSCDKSLLFSSKIYFHVIVE